MKEQGRRTPIRTVRIPKGQTEVIVKVTSEASGVKRARETFDPNAQQPPVNPPQEIKTEGGEINMKQERQSNDQRNKSFLEKVEDRAFFRSQRKAGEIKSPQDANYVQAEAEQLLIDEATKNSETIFDQKIGSPTFKDNVRSEIHAGVKPKTRKIGEVLGRIIGQAKKDKVEIQSLTNKAEDAAKVAVDNAKKAQAAKDGAQIAVTDAKRIKSDTEDLMGKYEKRDEKRHRRAVILAIISTGLSITALVFALKNCQNQETTYQTTPTPDETPTDVMAITSLPARPDANVNGVYIGLEVRDTNTSERPLFYNETGVNKTQPYTVNLPTGWDVITASVSATVQRQGGIEKSYKDTPVNVVKGPFSGRIEVFEGALRVVPSEWTDKISGEVLDIQRQQAKNPNLQVTFFSDN